jgi:hypothetical protein
MKGSRVSEFGQFDLRTLKISILINGRTALAIKISTIRTLTTKIKSINNKDK